MDIRVGFLSCVALLAFAGNSILCRLALANGAIDPSAFTAIRLLAGAMTLTVLVLLKRSSRAVSTATNDRHIFNLAWLAPLMLFAYAALFSFAYVSLDTGVGALILFGSVQVTLLLMGLLRGERFSLFEVMGLLIACAGLVYLVYPELSKPSISGFIMMSLAGVAWGIYTLRGQGSSRPLFDTNSNFVKAVPLGLLMLMVFWGSHSISLFGFWMALMSGALTSGVGYAVWYAALPTLTTSQAGVMQLLVPLIAAAGGVAFAGEALSVRLLVASSLTLGGILIVILAKKKA